MNIKAVARKARVSTATVSRTINGSASVRPKTAERVRKAIETLGFHPDVNARALGSGRSSLYGLIISDITNPFFPELVKAFEDIAVTHRKDILIANTGYDPERLKLCVSRMLQRRVDGVAIMTSEMDDLLLKDFSKRKIPIVLLDTAMPGPGISSVRIDHHAGMLAAVGHLAGLGHSQIAFISGPLRLPSATERHQGFINACHQHRIAFHPDNVAQGDHGVRGGFTAMEQLLASPRRCTAVVCSNDLTALGAMESIYENGLSLPEDISVVGYDGIELTAYTHPGLTTMSVPRRDLATTAFLSLLSHREQAQSQAQDQAQNQAQSQAQDQDQDQATGQEHIFTPTLVRRNSTAPPRKTL